MVSARHGTPAQPHGFRGLKLIFKVGVLKLVLKFSTYNSSPPSNILKYTLKQKNKTTAKYQAAEHLFEIRSFVLSVYWINNMGFILNTHWWYLSTLSFQLFHTHTHRHTRIHILTFSSSVVSCSSSLMGSVPSGNVPLPLSWASSGKSQGLVDSAISSSVALMTFRTSVDMLQSETAEYFCFVTRAEKTALN